MPSPDPDLLIRLFAGESVFDRDTDSKILQASNEMSARALFEMFQRFDTGSDGWEKEFADALKEISHGDPSVLIGFDDGRWLGLPSGEDEPDLTETDESSEYYLRLEFTDEEACYYLFDFIPRFDEPFVLGGGQKREGKNKFVQVTLPKQEYLQVFIQNLRVSHFLLGVHDSSLEEFAAAKSHRI